jgi:hypothetical protein
MARGIKNLKRNGEILSQIERLGRRGRRRPRIIYSGTNISNFLFHRFRLLFSDNVCDLVVLRFGPDSHDNGYGKTTRVWFDHYSNWL